MSGHSKWAGIKHKKAVVDAKRGQLFTKVAREITVAAREGGPDPAGNFRLRLAIQRARDVNMPAENIERAIQRAVGGKDGSRLEEVRYEGYGPHGVAIMIDALTDNRNRTVASIRSLFTRAGGSLGETNSVAWMFSHRGVIRIDPAGRDPEEVAVEVLDRVDLGEDGDVAVEGGAVQVTVAPARFEATRQALEASGYRLESAEVTWHPTTSVRLDARQAPAVLRLLEALEDHEDVQQVYANVELPDEVLETVS